MFTRKPNSKKAVKNNKKGTKVLEQGTLSVAEQCSKDTVKLYANSLDAYRHLGNNLEFQGQWDHAIACPKKAIGIDPDFAQA